jgi:hypothetical protein
MSKPGRNDRHNTNPIEGKLIHIGHYLWKLFLGRIHEMRSGLR